MDSGEAVTLTDAEVESIISGKKFPNTYENVYNSTSKYVAHFLTAKDSFM